MAKPQIKKAYAIVNKKKRVFNLNEIYSDRQVVVNEDEDICQIEIKFIKWVKGKK